MTRKEFIRICQVLGIGLPLQSMLGGCNDTELQSNFDGKVIIIGAGAGGMSAGYLLNQLGIEFKILEASSTYGGRMKTNKVFADFPIPLGAEWLHSTPNEFTAIVNDDSVNIGIQTVGYTSNDIEGFWVNGELQTSPATDSDLKFINSTWLTFYEDYILPSIQDKISFNEVVQSVDYSGSEINITTQTSNYQADKIIVATPLKILQDGDIDFTPALPSDKTEAMNEVRVWEGFKAFIEFNEKFYLSTTAFNIQPETDGQKLYYDASHGQNSSRHILGLFCVGTPALDYINRSGDDLLDFMLAELDEIYEGKATATYIKHMTQNWNEEPFIRGAYLSDHTDWRTVRKLRNPVDDKLYFAGGPFTDGLDWVAVHAAAKSAREAVSELIA